MMSCSRPSNQENVQEVVDVMSFNIRFGTADDGPNHWDLRKSIMFNTLKKYPSDFIGLQEALPFQVEVIDSLLEHHQWIGVPRDAEGQDEGCPIFFGSNKWKVIENGNFWLSENPDIPGSMSWNTVLPRIATWGVFEAKETGTKIFVLNTHFSHVSEEARAMSARVIKEKTDDYLKNYPAVIMGDLNALESSIAIANIKDIGVALHDAYRAINPDAPGETFYGWEPHITGTGRRIDYIFCNDKIKIKNSEVVEYNEDGRYPSDHNPLTARLLIRQD